MFCRSCHHKFKYTKSFNNGHLVQKIQVIKNMWMKIKCMSYVSREWMHACMHHCLYSNSLSLFCKSWQYLTLIHVLLCVVWYLKIEYKTCTDLDENDEGWIKQRYIPAPVKKLSRGWLVLFVRLSNFTGVGMYRWAIHPPSFSSRSVQVLYSIFRYQTTHSNTCISVRYC